MGLFAVFSRCFFRHPKVAVVLSGSDAKGTAHIGVLKAIEEMGIPIDYVVDTRMEAIVGH